MIIVAPVIDRKRPSHATGAVRIQKKAPRTGQCPCYLPADDTVVHGLIVSAVLYILTKLSYRVETLRNMNTTADWSLIGSEKRD